jgi:tetratricopeptide (TPR) repeat protein
MDGRQEHRDRGEVTMTDQGDDAKALARNEMSGTAYGPVLQAHTVRDIHVHQRQETGQSLPVPFQIPPAPPTFAGRQPELDALSRWLHGGRGRTIVLSGTAGVGKTALALHWLRQLRESFADGSLFVDLGHGTSKPVTPADALEGFLLALDVKAENVPVEESRREALYRSVTAQRRLVVLLDDAISAAQVRPLLPAGENSITVVTSRFRLTGLAMDGAHSFEVDPLDVPRSLDIFRSMLGDDRVQAEEEAARELVVLCGGLPLALSIVGARLATRPRRRLAHEVSNLRVERRRLAGMTIEGEASIEAVFDMSYADLADDAAMLYRVCASHPSPDFGIPAAAAALQWDGERAENALERLLEANFLTEIDDRRFCYHDLLRVHAKQRARDTDPVEIQETVLRRMIEWYLDEAVLADRVIHPHRPHLGPRYGMAAAGEGHYEGEHEALSWLEMRRAHYNSAISIAAQQEWHDLVWQMCEALWGFFLHTRHYGDWIRIHQAGIASAQAISHHAAEARLRSQLGFAYAKLRRYDESAEQNSVAYRLAEVDQDIQAMATATSQLGRIARDTGDLTAALRHYTRARDLQEEIGQWRGVALSRRRIGQILGKLDRYDEAAAEFMTAAQTMRQLGDTTQYARTLMALAESRIQARQIDASAEPLNEALSLMRELGSLYYQAEILAKLAEVATLRGDRPSAIDCYRQAAELYAGVEDPLADLMRIHLAELGQTDKP